MNPIYQVDRSLPIPVYQQLADSIRAAIKTGQLADGDQLPTVQELDLARGTIIRAYETLQREGLVEKIQGRGTFVRCAPQSTASRKEQAMEAIDKMLQKLEELGFSAGEINIFLNLKLRELSEEEAKVKIALIECNPETLTQMSKQLHDIPNVELHAYLMSSISQYPYYLGEDLDLILTTESHAQEVIRLLPVQKRVTTVALRPSTASMVSIIKLGRGDNVGILCQSQRFGELLQRTCRSYAEEANVLDPVLIGQETDLAAYLKGTQVLLLSEDLEYHCSSRVQEQLRRYSGRIVRCAYKLDQGSFLYLQEKCKRILKSKTI